MGKSRVRNFLRPHPLQYGINLKLPHKNCPKSFCAPPSACLKKIPPPPPFRRGKTSHAPPPSRFVAAPLPVVSASPLFTKAIKYDTIHSVAKLKAHFQGFFPLYCELHVSLCGNNISVYQSLSPEGRYLPRGRLSGGSGYSVSAAPTYTRSRRDSTAGCGSAGRTPCCP